MTDDELIHLLDGFCAYDTGSVDSGIRDVARKAEVKEWLHSAPDDDVRRVLSKWLRQNLTDEGIAGGYGWEDVAESLRWLEDRMDFS